MQPKSFLVLAVAAAASVALAVSAISSRDLPLTATASPGPLVDGLSGRLNDVRTVRITTGGDVLTLNGSDGGWSLAERGGYPVAADKVRALALAVANLELLEPRTAAPERLDRLELGDPAAEGAVSKRVELMDAAGAAMADIVVGKASLGLYGGGRDGVYVRRMGENQSWLAAGAIDLPGEAIDLLAREVVDVPLAEVAEVTLDLDAAAPVTLSRATPEVEIFEVGAVVPEGRAVDDDKVERVASALSSLTMQDVRPATETPGNGSIRRSRFETFDGLAVEVAVATAGEGEDAERWATFKASAEAATGDGAQATRDRAAALNAKLEGWSYKLSPFLADRLNATLDGLLAERAGSS